MPGFSPIFSQRRSAIGLGALLISPWCQAFTSPRAVLPLPVIRAGICTPTSPTAGSYNAEVRGIYCGFGTVTVSATSLNISITVQDSTGNVGTLSASLPLTNGRFNGSGVAMGQQLKLNGRVDAPDGVVRSARVLGTFTAPNGHFGRIAGRSTFANAAG